MRFLSRPPTPAKKARSTSAKARRPKPVPAWRRTVNRWMLPGLVLAALGGGVGWAIQSGTVARVWETTVAGMLQVTADAGLRVSDVLVTGRTQTRPDALLEAVAVRRDDPILGIDLTAARDRVIALPWVKEARIERRLPDTISVTLVERHPLALWQRDGRFTLVDQHGDVITDRGVERFRDLPIVIGDGAPSRASAALAMLAAEPELGSRVRALTWVGGRRWTVRLDGGIDVQLPESDPGRAWTHLATLAREHGVLERDVVTIDLRIPDQLILRVTPDAQDRTTAPGENT